MERSGPVWPRSDSLYSVSTSGGEPRLLFACPQNEVVFCIGDVSPQGVLVYIQPDKKVVVQGSDGQSLATNHPPVITSVHPSLGQMETWPL
ncbi:MAG: hypothetical protein U0401_12125 [Anaerolineae bacterium]